MTDDVELTPEEKLQAEAKEAAKEPPQPVPGAQGLPDEVRDGHVED